MFNSQRFPITVNVQKTEKLKIIIKIMIIIIIVIISNGNRTEWSPIRSNNNNQERISLVINK